MSGTSAPPSYEQAIGQPAQATQPVLPEREARPGDRDIEQETRLLPPGWVMQFSQEYQRFYFVDTVARGGPRSIWTHPVDDPDWLKTVPASMSPEEYVAKLWHDHPESTPEPAPHTVSQQLAADYADRHDGGPPSTSGQGVRQGGTPDMQSSYSGVRIMHEGQVQTVRMEDLVQHQLQKMGTPEEYERKHPPGKASKLFHTKESARQRQRRHAEHKAMGLAEELAYRAPMYRPYQSPYGYPAYGRPYGRGYGARGGYGPGVGFNGALLGLGGGALLGAALF